MPSDQSTLHDLAGNSDRGPVHDQPAPHPGNAKRGRAVATAAAAIAVATSGAVVTTPLFPVYTSRWDLSALTITSVYAAYIVGTLTALIFFGRLADRIGRRPVLLAALACAAAGTVVLLLAPGAVWLFPGRVLQGITVGLVSSAGAAALADITDHPSRAAMFTTASNVGGMAIGTLVAGLIAQYLPWPLTLPYLVYLAILAVVIVAVLRLREPSSPGASRAGPAASGPGESVPVGAFLTAAATTLVGFSSLALLLSLGPKLTLQWTSSTNIALGGLVACLACLAAGTIQLSARSVRPRRAITAGLLLILAGMAALLTAGFAQKLVLLFAAGLLVGVGYGFLFLGGLSSVQQIIPADRRATWLSAYFITAYIGMSVPAIGLGFLTDRVGLLITMEIFASYALVLSILIIVATCLLPGMDGKCHTNTGAETGELV